MATLSGAECGAACAAPYRADPPERTILTPMRRVRLASVVLAAALAVGVGAAQARAKREQAFTPVIQSVNSQPRWYKADDGQFHVRYEVILTNAFPVSVTLRSLEVRTGGGRTVETLAGADLEAAVTRLATPTEPTSQLDPSTVGVAWVDLTFPRRGTIPDRLKHRLAIAVEPGLPVPPTITSTGAPTRVASRPPVLIGHPLRGPLWTAIVGAHRRALQPVNGHLYAGQRFAIDWNLLDAEHRLVFGDPGQLTSYPSYGQPVLAVSDGKVVEAVDGIPDQDPAHFIPVGADQADGNFIVLRLARRTFAGYAHLVPGSVTVKRGDRVDEGEVLGKLGNSGNSDGPHLHFQVMNRPSLLASDGLPIVFRRFDLTGRMASFEAAEHALETQTPVPIVPTDAGPKRRVGLTDLDVLDFPDR
jgi:murein DD-endopeptidase MepM/ murein hydrolase activator NlpD